MCEIKDLLDDLQKKIPILLKEQQLLDSIICKHDSEYLKVPYNEDPHIRLHESAVRSVHFEMVSIIDRIRCLSQEIGVRYD